jgi:two-component system CheB/CheR fusion protein
MDHHVPARPLSVLVVDDQPAADTWSGLLTSWGHRPLVAYQVSEAWEAALAEKPDVVLLGIGSPGANAWDLARHLLAEPALHGIQVIALSRDHSEGDRVAAAAAGIRWHFVKPVAPDLLRGVLVVCGHGRGLPGD